MVSGQPTKNLDTPLDVYESTDDYDEVEFMRDANQHACSQDCKTLTMTQSDLNNLPKWLDEVKAAHTIRTNYGY